RSMDADSTSASCTLRRKSTNTSSSVGASPLFMSPYLHTVSKLSHPVFTIAARNSGSSRICALPPSAWEFHISRLYLIAIRYFRRRQLSARVGTTRRAPHGLPRFAGKVAPAPVAAGARRPAQRPATGPPGRFPAAPHFQYSELQTWPQP